MFYYKIIKNNTVVDINNAFFRYTKKHKNIIKCESTYAQLIQSSDGKNFYTTDWLCPIPEGVHPEYIEAVIITEEEYNSLKEQLKVEEAIPIVEEPIETAETEVETVPEQELEKVMSASEMRQRILELEKIVQQLLSK